MSNTYTTVQGDMWDAISYRVYGTSDYADRLMWANRQYLDYFLFPAGVVLILPEIEAPVSTSLPPWKKVVKS